MALSLFERGWRDAFWGRDPGEADTSYLEGFAAGLRKGDRTAAGRRDGAHAPALAPTSSSYDGDEAGCTHVCEEAAQ